VDFLTLSAGKADPFLQGIRHHVSDLRNTVEEGYQTMRSGARPEPRSITVAASDDPVFEAELSSAMKQLADAATASYQAPASLTLAPRPPRMVQGFEGAEHRSGLHDRSGLRRRGRYTAWA
jgi:hypothetical protein